VRRQSMAMLVADIRAPALIGQDLRAMGHIIDKGRQISKMKICL